MDIVKRLFCLCILLTVVGCNGTDQPVENKDVNIVQTAKKTPFNQDVSRRAVDYVSMIDEVNRVKAVNSDDTLLMSFDVNHLNRFRISNIEKDIKSDLEKIFPKHQVEVSYDRKIMLEVERLQAKMEKEKMKKEQLKKDMKKIIDLMKEKT